MSLYYPGEAMLGLARIAALGMRTTADLKRFVKNNRAVWALVSRIRKGLAKPAVPVAARAPDDAD